MAKKKKRTTKTRPTSTPSPSITRAAAVPRGDGGRPAGRPDPGPAANAKAGAVRSLDRKVTVRLGSDHFEELEAWAHREGFTVSVIVRHLLVRFIESKRNGGGFGGLL